VARVCCFRSLQNQPTFCSCPSTNLAGLVHENGTVICSFVYLQICSGLFFLVMCRLRLGLKAGSLTWLIPAQALEIYKPGPGSWLRLGPAWLWLKPRLCTEIYIICFN
jgi:hypothetical protein